MNQTQRKYAMERIDEISRRKIKEWEEANPKPPLPRKTNKKETVVGGGYYAANNPGLYTVTQEVNEMKAVVNGGLVAIDVDAANQALDRILGDIDTITQVNYSLHLPVFDLLNYIKLPENIRSARMQEEERQQNEVRQWEERRDTFVQPLMREANSLKDRVMLGDGAEALAALNQINAFAGEVEATGG